MSDYNEEPEVIQKGGVTSIQYGGNASDVSNAALPGTRNIQINKHGSGVTKIIDGELSKDDAQGIQYTGDGGLNYKNSGSVMSTLRTEGGSSNITGKSPANLVVDTIFGTTSLDAAEKLGVVVKDMNGNYTDADPDEVQAKDKAKETDKKTERPEHWAPNFEPEAESAASELVAEHGEGKVVSILGQIASRGVILEDGTLGGKLNMEGMTDDEAIKAGEVINQIAPEMNQQVREFMMFEQGLTPDEADELSKYFWSPSASDKRSSALIKHFSDGDLSGYMEILKDFKVKQRGGKG